MESKRIVVHCVMLMLFGFVRLVVVVMVVVVIVSVSTIFTICCLHYYHCFCM